MHLVLPPLAISSYLHTVVVTFAILQTSCTFPSMIRNGSLISSDSAISVLERHTSQSGLRFLDCKNDPDWYLFYDSKSISACDNKVLIVPSYSCCCCFFLILLVNADVIGCEHDV